MTMQTIWTRAAQMGSACRCPQCASSVQGVTRRTTASATRRMPRYLTTSTFLYSGIFAAAATMDAKTKRQRREQWDLAIADMKEELGQTQSVGSKKGQNPDKSTLDEPTFPPFPYDAASQLIEFGSHLDSSVLRRAKHWSPESISGPLECNYLAPQSLYASKNRKQKYLCRPWVEKKLERVRLCMDKFQLDIIQEIQEAGLGQVAASHVPHSYGQHILSPGEVQKARLQQKLGDIARLREEKDPKLPNWQRSDADVPLSAYRMDDGGDFTDQTRQLNQSLQILFRRRARGTISRAELLAKVAHNVSASTAPPNVDTFNTLIVGFAHLREKQLFNFTTLALSHTLVRPNEVTLASIFRFDTETGDFSHFFRWLRRLRGEDGGLHAARKDVVITKENQARLFARPDSDSNAIVQLPYPTPMVLDALVGGIVRFCGFNAALEVCRNMGQDGWGLSMAGLRPLLQDCAARGDWQSGKVVWAKIQELKAQSRKRIRWGWNERNLRWIWRSETIHMPTYTAMLKLCRKCEERDTFEQVVHEATAAHRITVSQLMQTMKKEDEPAIEPTFDQIEPKAGGLPRQTGSSDKRHTKSERTTATDALVENADLEPVLSPVERPSSIPSHQATIPYRTRPVNLTFHEEQLHGLLPGNRHLDEYELYERPMSMSAGG